MVFETRLIIIISTFVVLTCCLRLGVEANGSLDDMFEEYAHNSLPTHQKTGVLYNASLPSNLTGIEVSVIRLRWDSFWAKGANYSGFQMPPRIFSYPYSPRLDIVYSLVDNQSSYYYSYYNVANDHILVAPVVGFNVYGNNFTAKLNLTLFGGPILIRFPQVINEKAKCVVFYSNGTFGMSNKTRQDMCLVRDQGHFSMAVPKEELEDVKEKRENLWKWWVFGFGIGVLGLLLIGFIVFIFIESIRRRNIQKMEKEAEKNEVLETTYVGQSKMPLATVVRTQPVIENDYVP
ncbi:hypothetical protein SSX86_012443 [Deinandra increscens subsp. villosa]|uniref:Uncharacterized protein n=1 Tax=Deinandra increscens subsp. villosa TaxID=3103831 RepID=A0AAP0D8R1_9ASTR